MVLLEEGAEGNYQYGALSLTSMAGKMAQRKTSPTDPAEIASAPASIMT